MILLLETLLALGLIAQALVGLAFFISCCREGEHRAAFWAGVQAAAMLAAAVLFFHLWHSGFFSFGRGVYLLILATCLATGTVALLTVRIGTNPIARKGTPSLIAGPVARFDERMTVFARNRALRCGFRFTFWTVIILLFKDRRKTCLRAWARYGREII